MLALAVAGYCAQCDGLWDGIKGGALYRCGLRYWQGFYCWQFVLVLLLHATVLAPKPALAVEQIVELQLQRVRALRGVIVYPNGDPVRGAQVKELSPGWKETLRSTETDEAGRFTLTPVSGRKIYYLQISTRVPGVNLLRVPVTLSRLRGAKTLRLQLLLA